MPTLVPSGEEGERVSDAVVIKIDREELCVTESLYPEGRSGPDDHIHKEHVDAFYVVSGQLVFGVAGETVRLGAGGFVAVPPEVVHTFRNEGPGEARFLNFHAPNKGFGAYMRGEAETFDSFGPPEDGGLPASEAVIVRPGERVEVTRPEIAWEEDGSGEGYVYELGDDRVLFFRAPGN